MSHWKSLVMIREKRMRVENILFQLDISWKLFLDHVKDLTDDEALWCKEQNGLQIQFLNGKWQVDHSQNDKYHESASAAWMIWYTIYWWRKVLDHSFGEGKLNIEDVQWSGSVKQSIEEVDYLHDQWIKKLSGLTLEQLQSKQYTKWPFSNRSFYDLALWVNTEMMKSAVMIGTCRYFYKISNND